MTMEDDRYDILPVPDGRMWLRMGTLVAAAGFIVGGGEALLLSFVIRLPLGFVGMFKLALVAMLGDALLGLSIGLLTGLLSTILLGRQVRWRRYNVAFTAGVMGLGLFFLAPLSREVWAEGRYGATAGMLALIPLLGVVIWFNASYWFRRLLIGAAPELGFRGIAVLVGLLLGLGAATIHSYPKKRGHPFAASPNIILVTIDTLRRDHVGAYGSVVSTPRMDTLAREGILFQDAVAPLPETAPSHASMLTGLHPLEHGVVQNGVALQSGFRTVTEMFAAANYRTGAFVSSFAVDSSERLDQGFEVYDDDFFTSLRGLSEVRVARLGLRLLMRFGDPTKYPFLLERGAPVTIAGALDWAAASPETPMFLWVHLFEPHAPYEHRGPVVEGTPTIDHRAILELEPGYAYTGEEKSALRALYREEVEYTDTQLGVLLDGLKAAGRLDDARVIVVADHGESLGEHDLNFVHHGLYEPVIAVPLIFWSSKDMDWQRGITVEESVSVMDVASGLLEAAGLPLLQGTNSRPLQMLARKVDFGKPNLALYGRVGMSLDRGTLYGIRTGERVKCILGEEREEFYDLNEDPGEMMNIAAKQPEAMAVCKQSVDSFRDRAKVATEVDAATQKMLEELGYVDKSPAP